jgi:hypothetical protein
MEENIKYHFIIVRLYRVRLFHCLFLLRKEGSSIYIGKKEQYVDQKSDLKN